LHGIISTRKGREFDTLIHEEVLGRNCLANGNQGSQSPEVIEGSYRVISIKIMIQRSGEEEIHGDSAPVIGNVPQIRNSILGSCHKERNKPVSLNVRPNGEDRTPTTIPVFQLRPGRCDETGGEENTWKEKRHYSMIVVPPQISKKKGKRED